MAMDHMAYVFYEERSTLRKNCWLPVIICFNGKKDPAEKITRYVPGQCLYAQNLIWHSSRPRHLSKQWRNL